MFLTGKRKMGGSELHQVLRSLCFSTDWNYAVFWKLRHRARMMLTWEDAYYDNHGQSDDPLGGDCLNDMVDNLHDGHYSHDLLGLAVAKMSYYVYSLGEGIVGQVAVTGEHLWITGDKHVADSCSSFEHCDGWRTQFSAGIRTVAVVAVVPQGVVQLGSLSSLAEDLKLVNHIREIFLGLQSSLVGHISSLKQCSIDCSPCLSDASTRSLDSGNFSNCVNNIDRTMEKERSFTTLPSLGKPSDCSFLVDPHGGYPRKTIKITDDHQGLEFLVSGLGGSTGQLPPVSEISHMERLKREHKKIIAGMKDGRMVVGSEDNDMPSHDCIKTNLYNDTLIGDNFGVDISYSVSDLLDSVSHDVQNGVLCVPEPSSIQVLNDLKKSSEFQNSINNMDVLNTSFKFPAGCELYEALGPVFHKKNTNCDLETRITDTETVVEMPIEGMSNSYLLTTNSSSEHLLEAVVANVCHSGSEDKGEKSVSKSVKSRVTTEKVVKPPSNEMHASSLRCYSFERSSLIEEDASYCLTSSEACGVRSSPGISSTSHSRCSEQLERSQELAKVNKKRVRPGENCRPRPRDRQLIQDRIKELRELVPNGSKCSIDSLLERTIKHMLFMQCITKHADKIDKCAESKLLDKETGIRGSSSHGQGSSWAMEVGSHLKAYPIIVENIGMNGQMLVEMLSEECFHFLEIAEAIGSLGLTILKGVTEAFGDKTWMCFVVEGQNNRSMHRMDILWSLVQILESKTKT